jgi:iron complex outermembrane receptor protein
MAVYNGIDPARGDGLPGDGGTMTILHRMWWAGALSTTGGLALPSANVAHAAPQPTQEIVVMGEKLRGAVPGTIGVETRLDGQALQALGASNLADILAQISALTDGGQARSGDGPVLLVNGRRIGAFDEVRNLPPEAIERIDILPEEAALRLGYPARSKPVNIVLKAFYAAATGEIEDRVTTRGLRNDFNTEFNAVRIKGDNRLTLDAQYQIADAITEAKRGVVRPLDGLAANAAGVLSTSGGGALAPLGLAYAGVPAQGRSLGDFATAPAPADTTGAWRTLVPASQQLTANAAFARALGHGQTLAINAKYDRLQTQDMLGPAIADVTLPASAPFTVPLHLRRSLPDLPVQTRANTTDTLHFAAQGAGTGRWRWSVAGNADHVAQGKTTRSGLDASAWQAAINAGTLADAFAAPALAYVAAKPATHTSSRDDTFGLEGALSGTLARDIALTLGAKLARETLSTADATGAHRLARTQASGQIALDMPLLPARSALGALGAGVNLSLDHWSDAGDVRGLGGNFSWRPRKAFSLLVAAMQDAAAPTMAQLGTLPFTTQLVQVYDFASGTTAIATRLAGGNPTLQADERHILKAQAEWKLAPTLTLTATLTDITDSRPLLVFSGATPVFAAAYPARLSRNGLGTITSFDARPFNGAREHRQELRLAGVWNRSFGSTTGPVVPGKGGFGGGHAFGAAGSMVQLSLVETMRLTDRLSLAEGGPAYDLIAANPLGEAARVPRHRLDAQLSATHAGWGLRMGGVWTSGGRDGTGSLGQLAYADRFALNMRVFWFPGRNRTIAQAVPFAHGLRFLLAVDNLFDSWQQVQGANGQTPLAYQRGLIDPVGRTFRLSLRKTLD